jgi:hypothetical protein
MALTKNVLSATAKSINRLFEDTNLTSTITYKVFQGSSFSDSLGYAQEVFINFSLSAIRTERKRISLPSPGEIGGIAGVEINYLVQDLPEGYSNRDKIEHNGTNHQIEKISKIADLAYKIEVQGS